MNRLEKIVALKKDWGSEIIWGQTDTYVVKTVELAPNKGTPFFLHTRREKNFVVVSGDFYITYGECCSDEPLKTYKLPVGWSWYIEPRKLYRYHTMEKSARIIEVSSYQEDIDEFVFDDDVEMVEVQEKAINMIGAEEEEASALERKGNDT